MTREADAVLKFCPHKYAADRDGSCEASNCMAWRWNSYQAPRQRITCPDPHATVEEGMTRPARALAWVFAPWDGDDYPAQWLEPEAEHLARCEGYCGLAGKP